MAPGFLDGDLPCRRYAARVLEAETGWVIMGFADGGNDAFGGYVMDPVPLKVDSDGRLFIEPAG